MAFTPRPYQTEAINAGISFFKEKKLYNGLLILPTGSGKSVVVAHIAGALPGKTIILQPSKEILEQNVAKFLANGFRCGVYSASAGMKFLDKVTFATIGSIIKKKHLFAEFQNILIDEAHFVNANDGMYREFIKSIDKVKVLGLTATPYRLSSTGEGPMLKFLTRTKPKIFNKVLYYVQNGVLFDAGHLAKLRYFSFDVVDRTRLNTNSSGTDFTDASLRSYYNEIDMVSRIVDYSVRLLANRKNLLVFCSLIEEANKVSKRVPGSVVLTGETDKATREKVLAQFKKGVIKCVINVGVLTTGFDYPELETILISRSTMSLALYYQMVGRVMRPHKNKEEGWVVDLGGNIRLFGKVETMKIEKTDSGLFYIQNNGRQLTNVAFSKN
jgi:DNA repair protein RadD